MNLTNKYKSPPPFLKVNRMHRIILLCSILLIGQASLAQQMGANYNENLDQIDPGLINQSGTKWVRAFVNVLTLVNINNAGTITGVNTNAVNNTKIGPFLDCRQHNANLILSLKFDFKNLLGNRVPLHNTPEFTHIKNAIVQLLKRNAGGRKLGKNLAILTVGNEPMYETPSFGVPNYTSFTDKMINQMALLRGNNNWSYEIFTGAVNDFSNKTNDGIANATIDIAKTNNNVDGMDIHIHVSAYNQISADLTALRNKGMNKKLICTEFSLHRLVRSKMGTNLGNWGANNGYSSGMKIWQFINDCMVRRENNNPISPNKWKSFWNSRGWYQSNWFDQFYNAFESKNVWVATYGMVRPMRPGFRLTANSPAWVINAAFNDQILGSGPGGNPIANPFSHPRWKYYVDNPSSRLATENTNEEVTEPRVFIYPNPTRDYLNVRMDTPESGNISLLTIDGRTVMEKDQVIGHHKLYIGDLPKGIYLLRINRAGKSYNERIMIN